MALVWIVYVPTADRLAPDTTRMNKVEDLPDELARLMVGDGSARWPSEDEVAAYEETRKVEDKAAQVQADGDLTSLKKAELLDLAERRGVEVDDRATKADIVKALQDAQAASEAADVSAPRDADGTPTGFAQPGDIAAHAVLHPESAQPVAEVEGE